MKAGDVVVQEVIQSNGSGDSVRATMRLGSHCEAVVVSEALKAFPPCSVDVVGSDVIWEVKKDALELDGLTLVDIVQTVVALIMRAMINLGAIEHGLGQQQK